MPDRCEFICVTSSGRPSCRRREPPDRRAFVPKRGILFRKENTPFCCYRPQHCLFSALPCSAKNAGWQLARRWRGPLVCRISRLRPLPSAALLIFPLPCSQKMPDGSSLAAGRHRSYAAYQQAASVTVPALLIFRLPAAQKMPDGSSLAAGGNRSYAVSAAASVTVRSTAYTFFRCRRGRGRCGRSSAPCAAAFSRCRRPRWWRRCPRPRARA